MNTNEVKYTKDEEPPVTDNSKTEVIKAPGYFKLFECSKNFFKNLNTTYKCVCMENVKESHWGKCMILQTITMTSIIYNDKTRIVEKLLIKQ